MGTLSVKQAAIMDTSETCGPTVFSAVLGDDHAEGPVCAPRLDEELDIRELDALLDSGPLGETVSGLAPAPDDEFDAV
jgi:hypothetical protein